MVHCPFDINSFTLDVFLQNGNGKMYFEGFPVYQRGLGYNHFSRQRGAGVGSIFKGLWRFLLPMAKSVGKTVGNESLSIGNRVLNDLSKGETLKSSVINETSEGLKNLIDKAKSNLQQGSGLRKRKYPKKIINKNSSIIGRSVPKKIFKRREDSLGFY